MKRLLISLLLIPLGYLMFAQEKGYYRYPTLHENTVVFTAEGDLWKFDIPSGRSLRLTTHHGQETHASISPDGNWIAFNGQYEGPTEVYLLPIGGGVPQRLTYDGSNCRVYGWTPDGKIIYSSRAHATLPAYQLLSLDPQKLEKTLIPLSEADQGIYDEEGNLYFTRRPFQGSQTKRYKGGYNQNLWMFDGENEAKVLGADFDGTSKNPMYQEGRIYFLSDRDGVMNIWSMDKSGSELKQHSQSTFWDLKEADMHGKKIIYQKMADLFVLDVNTNKEERLDISIVSDFDQRRPQWEKKPMQKMEGATLSKDGKWVCLTARGRMFVAPSAGGRWMEVDRKSGIRYGGAEFLGEKDRLVYLSDESGEMELWETDQMGFEEAVQLTKNTQNLITSFAGSPDGSRIAYTHKDNRLLMFERADNSQKVIATGENGGFRNLSWSPDGKCLAYTLAGSNDIAQIHLYEVEKGTDHVITTDRLSSYLPVFHPDGEWLFFVSSRHIKNSQSSPWGELQPEPIYKNTEKLYALALQEDLKWPFLEENELSEKEKESEEDKPEENKKSKKKKKDKEKSDEKEKGKPIVLDGLMTRLYELPVEPANIGGLEVSKTHVYWLQRGEKSPEMYALKISNERDNKAEKISDDVRSFELSADQKKVLIWKRDGVYVGEANGKAPDWKSSKLKLDNWQFKIDPVEDWSQMLLDAWRLERDYFYDPDMHGVDWDMILEKHKPLLSRITDRYELDDLMASMVSELSALHIFVYGGEKRNSPDQIAFGYLGARLRPDQENKGYVIDHIYQSDPDYPEESSPLNKPHLSIREGDVITKINGVPVMEVDHYRELLMGKAGQQVRLELLNKDDFKPYEQIVKPISGGQLSNLTYGEWEYSRRLEVEEKSDKKMGYIHLRAMGGRNYDEFVKGFYPAFKREGLIIDVRHNNGGNIDSWVLEKLMRKAWFYWSQRTGDPSWNMQYAFRGHMVVLVDAQTASDGEAFAEGFRRLGLGKVIGSRTWGGEIWLSSSNRLVDRGIATAAEFGVFDKDGNWLIEGIGVVPDIEVDNLPHETFNGKDRQLEAAIDHLRKLMKEEPVIIPETPPFPDKSFDYKE